MLAAAGAPTALKKAELLDVAGHGCDAARPATLDPRSFFTGGAMRLAGTAAASAGTTCTTFRLVQPARCLRTKSDKT
jgi:hypothetical protein